MRVVRRVVVFIAATMMHMSVYADEIQYYSGSGIYVDHAGHFITNRHVIAECDMRSIEVRSDSQGEVQWRSAQLISANVLHDIALLRSAKTPINSAVMEQAAFPTMQLQTVGFPGVLAQHGAARVQNSSGYGIMQIRGFPSPMVAFSNVVSGGNSGGALVNTYGQLVGMVSGQYHQPHGGSVALALPVATIATFLRQQGLMTVKVKPDARTARPHPKTYSAAIRCKDRRNGAIMMSEARY